MLPLEKVRCNLLEGDVKWVCSSFDLRYCSNVISCYFLSQVLWETLIKDLRVSSLLPIEAFIFEDHELLTFPLVGSISCTEASHWIRPLGGLYCLMWQCLVTLLCYLYCSWRRYDVICCQRTRSETHPLTWDTPQRPCMLFLIPSVMIHFLKDPRFSVLYRSKHSTFDDHEILQFPSCNPHIQHRGSPVTMTYVAVPCNEPYFLTYIAT